MQQTSNWSYKRLHQHFDLFISIVAEIKYKSTPSASAASSSDNKMISWRNVSSFVELLASCITVAGSAVSEGWYRWCDCLRVYFNNHHALRSALSFTPSFCTLLCCTLMNQKVHLETPTQIHHSALLNLYISLNDMLFCKSICDFYFLKRSFYCVKWTWNEQPSNIVLI